MAPCSTILGSFIRKGRLKLGLTQTELAKKVGISQNLLSEFEIGNRKYLSEKRIEQFAKALKCEQEELRAIIPVKKVAEPKTDLGKIIHSKRIELGISLETIADNLGITKEEARRMELRKSKGIRYSHVVPLATVLELEPSEIAKFAGVRNKKTRSKFGKRIRDRRKELGISATMLAEQINVSREYISQIELGKYTPSENDKLVAKLAEALKLDVNELECLRPKKKNRVYRIESVNTLGGFLAAKRLKSNLTQEEVSLRINMSRSFLCSIERGLYYPNPYQLEALAKVLGCKIPDKLIRPLLKNRGARQRRLYNADRYSELGNFLTKRRLELKLSQAQVAKKSRLFQSAVSQIEAGAHVPNNLILRRISKALKCEIPAELIEKAKAQH